MTAPPELTVSVLFAITILMLRKLSQIFKSKKFVKKQYAVNSFEGFRCGYRLKIAKEWPAKHERKILLCHFNECCDEAEQFMQKRLFWFIFPRHFNKLWGFGWHYCFSDKNAHKWHNTATMYYTDMLREFKNQLQP